MSKDISVFKIEGRPEIEAIMEKNFPLFTKSYHDKIDMFDSNIQKALIIQDKANHQGAVNISIVADLFGNINMVQVDLLSIVYYIFYEKRTLPKIYFSRQSALLIYESFNDFDKIRGQFIKILKKYIEAGYDIQFFEGLIDRVEVYKKRFIEFKKMNNNYLRDIRMNTIGHRDPNFKKQIEVMSKADPLTLIGISMRFDEIVQFLNDIMHDYLNRCVKFE